MKDYKYVAIDSKGKTTSGIISAESPKDARVEIRKEKLTLLKLEASKSKVGGKSNRKSNKTKDKKISGKKLSRGSSKGEKIGLEFLKRLHELHSSGMPIADSVKLLNLRLSDPFQKEIAGELWRELAEGRTLSRAMRLLPQYFSESSTFVIEAGEATGNLSPILAKIITHLEEKREYDPRFWGV